MKRLILLLTTTLSCCSVCPAQSIATQVTTLNAATTSTVGVCEACTLTHNSMLAAYLGLSTVIIAQNDSVNLGLPIYGVGVFSAAATATITATAVKSGSIIQVGWFGGTVPSYTVSPIYVPTSTITAGTSFVVKAAASNSDSFYYFIWNHN